MKNSIPFLNSWPIFACLFLVFVLIGCDDDTGTVPAKLPNTVVTLGSGQSSEAVPIDSLNTWLINHSHCEIVSWTSYSLGSGSGGSVAGRTTGILIVYKAKAEKQ